MSVDDRIRSSYDEVPYEGHALAEAHPERLAVVGRLFGLEAPEPARARVLELGCAAGQNLIPLALAAPEARFVGVDLSPRQIEFGREIVRSLGLKNIELRAVDLRELGDDGPFDYILCHGVYSWVPEPAREAILAACGSRLAPEGLAYVSYNTLPGWHFPSIVRELMLYASRDEVAPASAIRRARKAVEALRAALPEAQGLSASVFREEAGRILPKSDAYLIHEHLAPINRAFYLHEFLDRAREHGLRFVGEARIGTMAAFQASAVRESLSRLAEDVEGREQYFDFLRNRRFRRTILVRADRTPRVEPDPEALRLLRVAGLVLPEPPTPGTPATFKLAAGGGRVQVPDPGARALLESLADALPRSLPFETLATLVEGRVARASAAPPSDLPGMVLQAHAAGLVELHAHEPALADDLADRPRASPLARRQAKEGRPLVNLRSRVVEVGDFDRYLLTLLDGRRDRDALGQAVEQAHARGTLAFRGPDDRPIDDPARLRSIGAEALGPALRRLSTAALLVP